MSLDLNRPSLSKIFPKFRYTRNINDLLSENTLITLTFTKSLRF